jgi:hypothetical protein
VRVHASNRWLRIAVPTTPHHRAPTFAGMALRLFKAHPILTLAHAPQQCHGSCR